MLFIQHRNKNDVIYVESLIWRKTKGNEKRENIYNIKLSDVISLLITDSTQMTLFLFSC